MAANDSPKTLQEAVIYYADKDTCQQALVAARWPDGVVCPTCGRKDVAYLANQLRWQCKGKHPKRQFSAKVGTIFEDSPINLSKWFVAIWLIASAKNGISSYELHRSIGVTQKSAWFMLHRIRLAMQAGNFEKKFEGHIEADETFIGGRARFMHWDKRKALAGRKGRSTVGKVAVMGLLERHGQKGRSQVHTRVVPNTRRFALLDEIRNRVQMGGDTTLITDAHKAYFRPTNWGRPGQFNYIHKVIDHAEKYVDGQVHTNGMENYWALLKRMIKGTYVSVEPFHLFRYLDEQALRFNTRKMTDAERFKSMTAKVVGKRLTYAELIGQRVKQSA